MSRLASFVAGFGGGYLKADRQRIEDERQAKLDKMREDELAMRKEDFAMRKADAERLRTQQDEIYNDARTKREQGAAITDAVAKANQTGKIEENVATANWVDASGQQKSAYQPDAETAKFALQQQALEEGSTPDSKASVGTATSVSRLDGSRELFSGMGAADKAKAFADANQPGSYSAYMNLRKRLMAMPGGEEAADKALERARKAGQEGAYQALDLAQRGDYAGAAKLWNSTGQSRLAEGQFLGPEVGADGKPTGRIQVFNADKSVVVPDAEQTLIDYIQGPQSAVERARTASKNRSDLALKQWEYQNDPSKRFINMKPGSELYDTKNGKSVTTNTAGLEPVLDADGNPRLDADGDPMYRRAATTKANAKAEDPRKVINDALEFVGKNSTLKDQSPDVVARVQQYTYQIVANNKTVPPEMAGAIAIDVGLNPAKLQPRLDLSTGSIDQVYESPEAGQIKFQLGYANALRPNGVTPEQMKGFANQLIQAQPAGIKDKLVSAAFDKTGVARRDLESGVKGEINAIYDKQLKDNPNNRLQIEAARNATIKSSMDSIGRKLDMVANYYPKPKADAAKGTSSGTILDRLKGAAGMSSSAADQNSNKYAGMTRPQMDAAIAQEARDWRANNPRPKADPKQQAQAKAQLAELEQQRSVLLRQGKSVEANAATDKIRSLKSQYGI